MAILLADASPQFARALIAALRDSGESKLAAIVPGARIHARCLCERSDCSSFWAAPDEIADRISASEMVFVTVPSFGEVVLDYIDDQLVYVEFEEVDTEIASKLQLSGIPGRRAPF